MPDPPTTAGAFPSTRWRLTAPESYILLHGPEASPRDAFKLGLMELVARGALVLDNDARQSGWRGTRRIAALRDGPNPITPREIPLQAIWDLWTHAPRSTFENGWTAVTVDDLAKAAARQYRPLRRYVEREIRPVLLERGLYEVRAGRLFWIFPTTSYARTPDGEAARAELQQWLTAGESRFAEWTTTDPRQALAYAGGAGAALLLMPLLFGDLQRLRERAVSEGGASTMLTPYSTSSEMDSDGPVEVDVPDLSTLDLPDFGGLDFSVFDSLGDALSAIDSAVDSAVSDFGGGGSDGGGGGSDGGGGGSDGGGGGGGGGSDGGGGGGDGGGGGGGGGE